MQMLNVAADNASSNDTLVAELAKILPSFGGETNRTRCFLHIVNLVAKSLLREFEKKGNESRDTVEEGSLTEDEEDEEDLPELEMQEDPSGVDDEGDRDDDEDGWVDEAALLSANERAELMHSIRPIKVVLTKVNMNHLPCHASHALAASQTRIQNTSLHHHTPSRVEINP